MNLNDASRETLPEPIVSHKQTAKTFNHKAFEDSKKTALQ